MVLYVAVSGENKIKCYPSGDPAGECLEATCPGPFQLCVSPDGRFLFAAGMGPENEHVSFSIDPATGGLTHISTVVGPVPGGDGCHISTDATGSLLMTAYYSGACVSVLPISPEGVIGSNALQVLPTTKGCHSIHADPSNRFAYATCIATGEPSEGNAIFSFSLDASNVAEPLAPLGEPLKPQELVNTVGKDGKNQYGNRGEPGPRHFCFHPTLPLLYTVDEQGNTVTSYSVRVDGTLVAKALQSVATLPDARTPWSPNAHGADSATSELAITPDGRCLYVGNRHQQAVAGVRQSLGCFVVDEKGLLTPARSAELGHAAQSVCVDGNETVYTVGGDDDGNGLLSAFRIDSSTAELTPRGVFRPGPGLMCVLSHRLASAKL